MLTSNPYFPTHPRWFHAGGDMFRILRFGRWLKMLAAHVWKATQETQEKA